MSDGGHRMDTTMRSAGAGQRQIRWSCYRAANSWACIWVSVSGSGYIALTSQTWSLVVELVLVLVLWAGKSRHN